MARITNLTRYPNAIPATRDLVNPALLSDPRVFPPPDVVARFYTITQAGSTADRSRTRLWSRFKAGA
jgi:putrescine transport system substrate-binding protein